MRRNWVSNIKLVFPFLLPIIYSLLVGSIIILITGNNPLKTFNNLIDSGFSCQINGPRCPLFTTMQFATPLILMGLSSLVALRANFITLGQGGQMLLGSAAATWIAANINLPSPFLSTAAIFGAALFGSIWGLIPAILKEYLGMNEILTTLLFNSLASFLLGFIHLSGFPEIARLVPIIPRTKLTVGLPLAFFSVWIICILLWKTKIGLKIRNSAQAPRFSQYGGIRKHTPILHALLISGALAGIAGAIEVLGVHYKFVNVFTAVNDFDGLIIAITGRLHPFGVLFFAFLIGGLRNGAITGLQIRSGIPREMGGAIIALVLLFSAMVHSNKENGRQSTIM